MDTSSPPLLVYPRTAFDTMRTIAGTDAGLVGSPGTVLAVHPGFCE